MASEKVVSIEVRKEINGIEMGVLSDGTPFLSMRALSKLCGIANRSISETASTSLADKRESKLAQWLLHQGVTRGSLYIKTELPGVAGSFVYAFPEDISTLILKGRKTTRPALAPGRDFRPSTIRVPTGLPPPEEARLRWASNRLHQNSARCNRTSLDRRVGVQSLDGG